MKQLERWFENGLFASRWLLAPFYVGLIISIVLLLVVFGRTLFAAIPHAAGMHVEQEIEVAHPRVTFEIRKTAKPGFHCLKVARILEVRDKTIVFDETFAPPVIATQAHPVVAGWIERVIGWMDTRLETLSRYAADYLGIEDRGRLVRGAWADVVVFDREFALTATFVEGESIVEYA